jgi:hypothetical protein
MSSISKKKPKFYSAGIIQAFVNGSWYYRLYINQDKIKDCESLPEAVRLLEKLVVTEENTNDERNN